MSAFYDPGYKIAPSSPFGLPLNNSVGQDSKVVMLTETRKRRAGKRRRMTKRRRHAVTSLWDRLPKDIRSLVVTLRSDLSWSELHELRKAFLKAKLRENPVKVGQVFRKTWFSRACQCELTNHYVVTKVTPKSVWLASATEEGELLGGRVTRTKLSQCFTTNEQKASWYLENKTRGFFLHSTVHL